MVAFHFKYRSGTNSHRALLCLQFELTIKIYVDWAIKCIPDQGAFGVMHGFCEYPSSKSIIEMLILLTFERFRQLRDLFQNKSSANWHEQTLSNNMFNSFH